MWGSYECYEAWVIKYYNPLHTNASDIRTAIFKTMREYGMLVAAGNDVDTYFAKDAYDKTVAYSMQDVITTAEAYEILQRRCTTPFNIMFIDMTEEEITETCKHLVAIHEYYRALNRDECKLLCKINKISSTYHAAPTQYTDILQADVVICKDFDQNGLWVREYAILHGIPVQLMKDITQVKSIGDITSLFAKKTNTNMEKSKQ